MNREIKFRGIDNITNEWIYGLYYKFKIDEKGNNAFILKPSKKDDIYFYKVNPETIGQYTGLKDKNGVEIYEGDIVKGLYGIFQAIVEWNDSFCGIFPFCNDRTGINPDECEVIGNIFENEELLEDEN